MAEDFEKKNSMEELDELIRSVNEDLAQSDDRMVSPAPPPPPRTPKPTPPAEPKDTASPGRRTFIYVAAVLLVSMALAFFLWICMDDVCALTRDEAIVTVTVAEGDTAAQVADTLADAGLIRQKWLFRLYCAVAGAEKRITPGTYDLNAIFDYHALVNGMASTGRRATATVTVPEGYECREIFALLEEKGVCSAEELRLAAADTPFEYRFLEGLPLGDPNRLEGCLFPDTYEFYLDDEPENVLNKFLRNTENKLTDELWEALDALNDELRVRRSENGFTQEEITNGALTMHDVLIVASLIERETAGTSENGLIGSVIYNRLCSKVYPCLNIDATIQYALPERKDVLSEADKLVDSPYNTYKYAGLPAGAIANPGMLAIRGALFPQETNYYFYALGEDGTHTFTRTYDEHLAFLEGLNHE